MQLPKSTRLPLLVQPFGPFLPHFTFPLMDRPDGEAHPNRLAREAAERSEGFVILVSPAEPKDLLEALESLSMNSESLSMNSKPEGIGKEELSSIGTLAQISEHEEEGARYMHLVGVCRVSVEQVFTDGNYPTADYRILEQEDSNPSLSRSLGDEARQLFESYLHATGPDMNPAWLVDPIRNESSLPAFADRCAILVEDAKEQQEILNAIDLPKRLALVIKGLQQTLEKARSKKAEQRGEEREFLDELSRSGYEVVETVTVSSLFRQSQYVCRSTQDLSDKAVALVTYRQSVTAPDAFAREVGLRLKYQSLTASCFQHIRKIISGAEFTALIRDPLEVRTLATMCAQDGGLPIDRVVGILKELCTATIALEQQGIEAVVISEDEVLLTADGRMFVSPPSYESGDNTIPGLVHSSETLAGKAPDSRAKVYGLGALGYFMLTGAGPHGSGISAMVSAMNGEAIKPIESLRPECPAELAAHVRKCLEKNPDDRFQSVTGLLESLQKIGA